jgi:cell division protein ZapA (FtsZ GTPase activity inhibitor)
MEELTIAVTIADRPYRLKINTEEEEIIRKATRAINERIREYSNSYAFNDRQDLVAMATLHFAALSLKMDKERARQEEVLEGRLGELDRILSEQIV